MKMIKVISLAALLSVTAGNAWAATNVISGTCVGEVRMVSAETNNWRVAFQRLPTNTAGVDEFLISLKNDKEVEPPEISVSFSIPQMDTHFIWHSGAENPVLPPKWHRGFVSNLTSGMPLMTLINANDRSRIAFAASEAVLPVRVRAGLKEENCTLPCEILFFTHPVAAMKSYAVKVRIDRRDQRWDDAVRSLSAWMTKAGNYVPMAVPDAAREPLYSTWYAFLQDVSASKIEDEARRASKLGMKTLILDDGWQTDEEGRAYERCGDLTVSKIKFPEGMGAHVAKVRAMGVKYMVWYAISLVGYKNAAYERFKDKCLRKLDSINCAVLDPRFPEVRQYLIELFAQAQREWGVDGFKIDYIGQFDMAGKDDPALEDNYAGRDFKSIPDAVDTLMAELIQRLQAVNPDILIEYRQPYLSPAIRRFGNMIRAIDCPGEMQKNIIRTAMLRLTSGDTAVHSDMLEWNVDDTAEHAAKPVLAAIFSTIQYSMMLSKLPASHLDMIRHWIGFTQAHREVLQRGKLTTYHPELNYPMVKAETESERVIAVYADCAVATVEDGKRTFVINATGLDSVALEVKTAANVEIYDTFGKLVKKVNLPAGLTRLVVPVSGYIKMEETK